MESETLLYVVFLLSVPVKKELLQRLTLPFNSLKIKFKKC